MIRMEKGRDDHSIHMRIYNFNVQSVFCFVKINIYLALITTFQEKVNW